ncbi:hypothetical protein POJ06DRAFT_256748 [Lipomyces tetrasporus]|uniref:Uncharacterized protein n=1 Tax=Lipomyces tetrasporus TaxID=54092 RepID=A0AAD7QQ38_9ASCO|nr:uncharacterized protein POJ06DRAFT_256748 [Lipomyces tetrasporus]KAJ8099350.1 hypothetical protein POJ06DRAFT_256748 [Lipomyces tetrasporus]
MRQEKYTRRHRRAFYLKFTLRNIAFIVSHIVYYRILLRYSIVTGLLFTSLP